MSDLPDVNQKANAPEASGATEPEYITKEDFGKFRESFDNRLNEWYRGVQSENQRLQNEVKKNLEQFDKHMDLLKSQGVEVDPEQLKSMRSKVELETISSQQNPPDEESEPEADNEAGTDYVTRAGEALMKRIGATVDEGDPELVIIQKAASGTPEEYWDAVAEAAETKKARLEREAKDPAARMNSKLKGIPSSNSIENVNNPTDLWRLAQEEGFVK